MDAVPPSVMIVRARRGVVRESKRVCHLVPVPDLAALPNFLTAYCGTRIERGETELVGGPQGMPCVECLMVAPVPGLPEPRHPHRVVLTEPEPGDNDR